MSTATPPDASDAPGIVELDRQGGRELLDDAAEHYLGLTGEEFMRALDAGEFDDRLERPEIARLVILLPFGR